MSFPAYFRDSDEASVSYDGSPVSWRISAYAVAVENSALLLIKNSDEKLYDAPGGGIEVGETIAEGLIREGREEAGVELVPGDLITSVENFFFHRGERRFYHSLLLFYHATRDSDFGTPTDSRISMAKFISFSELKNYPLFSPLKTALRCLPELANHAIT